MQRLAEATPHPGPTLVFGAAAYVAQMYPNQLSSSGVMRGCREEQTDGESITLTTDALRCGETLPWNLPL